MEMPSGSRNVVVVYGDNMRGKTSFLNSIRFAFFGYATARQSRQIDRMDLINEDAKLAGDWSLFVSVELDANGSQYELRRELRPFQHVAHPVSSKELQEIFTLRKDGIPVTGQDRAFEMNQLMPEGISRFFLFDGELLQEYEMLVRDENSALKIKQAIEHVLGLPALTKGGEEIRTLLTQAQARQSEDLKQLRTLTAQAEQQRSLQSRIADTQKEKGGLEARVRLLREETSALLERLESMTTAVEQSERLRNLEFELASIVAKIKSLRARRADLLQEAWRDLLEPQLAMIRRGLEDDRDAALKAVRASAITSSRIADLRTVLADRRCVLCEQGIHDAESHLVMLKLQEIEARAAQSGENLSELSVISSKIEQLARIQGLGLAHRVLAAEKETREVLLKETSLRASLVEVRASLREFEPAAVERLRSEREQKLAVSIGLQKEIEVRESEISTMRRKLDQLSRMLSRNPESRGQRSSKLVAAYSALDKIFTAGVDRLRDRQRRRVQDYAADSFIRLTSEPDFGGLSINENYGLTILDEKGRSVTERSAGAEQIVALALIDGLNKAGRRGGPIVMDTPFGRLDWTHRANVLKHLPEMAEQVILLVHEGEMDRDRDLPSISHRISRIYRIERQSSRQSSIVLEREVTI